MHYNRGWANGFHYGIRYWEIWNEPDFRPFWDGTPEEFYELYKTIALAIRSVDHRAKVGGPASTSHNDYFGTEDSFLQFIVDNSLPMDFYSWHLYTNKSNNPYDFPRFAQHYRDLLDRFGFSRAQVICSEWNSALDGSPVIGGEAGQAVFVAESLIYSQDSPIDKSFYYSFIPVLPTPHREHNAFAMVSSMNQTPIRVKSTGGDNQEFAVMAGRSFRRQELRVLVANYEISDQLMGPIPGGNDTEILVPGLGSLGTMTSLDRLAYTYQNTNGYDLEINNIPINWGDLTVEQYRIDNNHNYELVASTTISLEDRARQSISVSGDWAPGGETIVQNPPPPMGDGASWVADPAPGVSQGIDLIVVTGSNQCNGNRLMFVDQKPDQQRDIFRPLPQW